MPPQQRYVSRELTHFVGRVLPDDEARYGLLVDIMKSGWLTHPPHEPRPSYGEELRIKAGRLSGNEVYCAQRVCFCDIPVADLAIHMAKYSKFGVAFLKSFLIPQGASPVFYVARASTVDQQGTRRDDYFDRGAADGQKLFIEVRDLLGQLSENPPSSLVGFDYDKLRLRHTAFRMLANFHVFSFMQFFDHEKDDDDRENLYMEREWRLLGNLHFALDNVCRVILPEPYAKRFRRDLSDYCGQITFAD